jgi:phage gp36-like protein
MQMAYITTSQLSERLGATVYARLTDRVNGTTASSTVAQQIVDEAQAEADSFLARRYQTPVDVVVHPELANILRARVLDLAEYAAWKSTPFVSDPPQRVHLVYAAALRWFEDVGSGKLPLPAAFPPHAGTAEDNSSQYTAQPRRFTTEELDGL